MKSFERCEQNEAPHFSDARSDYNQFNRCSLANAPECVANDPADTYGAARG